MLIGEKIKSPGGNQTWNLVLQLKEIVSLICAPAISAGQIAYLRVVIDEYLHFRKQAFPGPPLKPKHHYVSHYPELIIRFGPLICLWTLRFESKHTYFKQCARKQRNFKNLCSSLVERHQLLQAYLNAGKLFPPAAGIEKAADSIRESVSRFNLIVVINENPEGFVMGKLIVVLVHNGSTVYFITKK